MAITAGAVPFMNDSVAMHYDANGNIDRYGSKYENFIFPVVIIALTLFWSLFIQYFEKKSVTAGQEKDREEAKSNGKVLYLVAVGTTVMFGIMQCVLLYSIFIQEHKGLSSMPVDINVVTNVLIGILLIVMGNYMPKAKLNSLVGVRTPWSMKNDVIWAKSNRFGGMAGVFCGIMIIIETLMIKGLTSTLISIFIIILLGVTSTIYSYYAYKKVEIKS